MNTVKAFINFLIFINLIIAANIKEISFYFISAYESTKIKYNF